MFAPEEKRGKLRLVASPDGALNSVKIHSDTRLYAALIHGEETLQHTLDQGRIAYLHVARGQVQVNGEALDTGDALMLTDESLIEITHGHAAEILLFDLPPAAKPRMVNSH
jgi:redox-sensitive bicupin YhaK (pirin superfamily)